MQQFKRKDYVTILLVITNIAVYIFCTIQGNLAWYQNIEGDAKDDFPVL